ncbi:MAG: Mov34/MPN/PAD-1 family protein [Nitrosopumilus sp.]
MQKIVLSQLNKKILRDHAIKEQPNESCAILFGKENQILDIFITKNIEESPTTFTISSEQLIKAYNIAEKKDMEIIGIFHSHPTSDAYPSNTDRKFMLSNPVTWIIYSCIKNEFRAYFLNSSLIEIPIYEK